MCKNKAVMKFYFPLIFAFAMLKLVVGAKILAIFPNPFTAHHRVFHPILKELSLRGHELTVFTTNPMNDPQLENIIEIDWSFSYDDLSKIVNETSTANYIRLMTFFRRLTSEIPESQLKHHTFREFIKNKNLKFDLILCEYSPPVWFALSKVFNCPFVLLASMQAPVFSNELFGNPVYPTLFPCINLPFGNNLSLYEKILSVLAHMYFDRIIVPLIYAKQHSLAKQYIREDLPPVKDIGGNASLLFTHTIPGFHRTRPNVPSIMELTAIHIQPPKSLPKDIQQFLDSAVKGAIYFSLGTNLKVSEIDHTKIFTFFEVFSNIPYHVIWKCNASLFKEVPKNVFMDNWLPQQDVLRHPNVKAFITQGGLQSIQEAILSHVPLIGIPIFGDQFGNVKRIAEIGLGVGLTFQTLSKESLTHAIYETVKNPKYKLKAKELADISNDQFMKPMDKAIWWIEYVIRHKGARHLRSPLADESWHEYYSLDVVLVAASIVLLFLTFVFVLYKVISKLFIIIFKTDKLKTK